MKIKLSCAILLFLTGTFHVSVNAQWLTQQLNLVPGWNSVYLHVDASYASISSLVGELPVDEIWYWKTDNSTSQFAVQSPDSPNESSSRWVVWRKINGDLESELKALVGNSAYLFYVNPAASSQSLSIKGKPKPPNYHFNSDGLNLVGFPVHPSADLNIESYFAAHAGNTAAQLNTSIYAYDISGDSNIAKEVNFPEITPLSRGTAYWVNDGLSNDHYVAPFSISLSNPNGLDFGDHMQVLKLRIQNNTDSAIIVNASTINSESPPAGQGNESPIGEALLMQVSYGINGKETSDHCPCEDFTIKLGAKGEYDSQWDLSIALDRSILADDVARFSGILQLEDEAGHSQFNIPVMAEPRGMNGMWAGNVFLDKVSAMYNATTSEADKPSPTPVPTKFPLRYILYRGEGDDQTTDLHLFQRVFSGLIPAGFDSAGELVASNTEMISIGADTLRLENVHRFSTTHLPFTADNLPASSFKADTTSTPKQDIALGGIIQFDITTDYDSYDNNPFLHAFHPDHDNLDASFSNQLSQGNESFGIRRQMTFKFTTHSGSFEDIILAGSNKGGIYEETLTLEGKNGFDRSIDLQGTFILQQVLVNRLFLQN